MAKAAEQFADLVIVTQDNPRTEDPNKIEADILTGFSRMEDIGVIPDREEAIKFTIENAVENDVIVIAGKGHENYQIIGDKTLHFSDQEVAEAYLTKIKNRMIKLTPNSLLQILNADLIGDEQVVVEDINTDTRKAVANSLFFALKESILMRINILDKAVEQGATALVVQQANTEIATPQLVVADTRLALGQLAKWLREKINPRTVAMTGSSGKTTVKEMTASILQQTAGNAEAVLFTNGNFNNDIGVPLTLLRLTEQHKFAVIELGANHQGEIDYTTHLAQPEAALVNNVAAAHLEGFGSIEGVAQSER